MGTVKLDENVPDTVAAILRANGHDVALAREQQLAGAADDDLLRVASAEGRVLVTLDRDCTVRTWLDGAHPTRFQTLYLPVSPAGAFDALGLFDRVGLGRQVP